MSIKEIAEMAGVSKSTVSRYLNGGYVSSDNKEKIKRVIEETGFTPSLAAQVMRTKKTKQIGIIIPKLNSDSISKMVSGITEVLNEQGYYVLLANINNDEAQELNYLSIFDENHVDGIILIGTIFTEQHEKIMSELKIPIVILSQEHEKYPCVCFDNFNASYDITKELVKGHRYPAIISSRIDDISTGKQRIDGFEQALKDNGLECVGMEISSFDMRGGYEACKRLLERNALIDCILCTTDTIALGAIHHLKEIGKKIPTQISIASVGGSNVCKITTPTISSANLDYKGSGKASANILLGLINNEKVQTKIKTEYKIEKLETTNC